MNPETDLHRREFMQRAVRCTLAVAGATAMGLGLWDRHGPQEASTQTQGVHLRDYSVPGQAGRLAVVHGGDRISATTQALEALGGMQRFVDPGERVLLKVNAAFASPPLLGATTHPDLVTRVTTLCYRAGAAEVLVTDNPINDPASCFRLTGIDRAARQAGARVVLPVERHFGPVTVPGGRLIRDWPVLLGPLEAVDKVIGLAPVKDHHRSGASMTLKNWYGLLGGRRNIFHQDIHTIITELALMVRPTLVILDGSLAMMTNGPTGGSLNDLKATGTLIAGTDPVAVDARGVTLLGRSAGDLPHLEMAADAGAGTTDYQSLRPIELRASA